MLANCTGASTTPPGPSPAPAMTATLPPQTLVPATGGAVALPAAANGQVASLIFAANAPSNLLIAAAASTTAPGGAPAPSSVKRETASLFGAVPFYWVTFTVTQPVASGAITGASVTLAGQPPDTQYYTEFDDITATPGVKLTSAGPGTVASGAATIDGAGPALTTGHTYLVQFYYLSLSTTPSPNPSVTPTASGSPTATPSGSVSPTPTPTATASTGPATPVPTYTFSGSSATATCTTASCTALNLVSGTLTVQFGAASAAATISGSTADGAGQISPSGFPFLLTSGTLEQYLAVSSSVPLTFAQTPQITLTSLTGVSSCIFYGYTNDGSSYMWTPIAPATGGAPVTSGTVVIPPVSIAAGTVNVQVSPPFYGAIICQ